MVFKGGAIHKNLKILPINALGMEQYFCFAINKFSLFLVES